MGSVGPTPNPSQEGKCGEMGRWGDGEMGSDWLGFYGADKVLPIDYKTECCFLITPRNNPLVSSSSLLLACLLPSPPGRG
ncbi:MAG: hypothetical protein F6K49_11325 [Moorea sp. SIO3I6]|nr:hypothetical protein [Moorena sp. SIO3I6]